MRLPLPLAFLAALVLAGCASGGAATSTDGLKGEEKDVAQVIADLSEDATRQRQARVCGEILTEELQRSVAGSSSCPDEVEKAFEDADDLVLEVDDVTVTGSDATAVVTTGTGDEEVRRTFELVKVGDDWRISSFGDGAA